VVNHLSTYTINEINKMKKKKKNMTIKQILYSNKYDVTISDRIKPHKEATTKTKTNTKTKWAMFT